MGCAVTKQKVFPPSLRTISKAKSADQINDLHDLKFTPADLIKIKFCPITQDYTVSKHSISANPDKCVKQVIHKKTNIVRAAKIIKKATIDEVDRNQLYNEITILKNLDHPNIIKIIDCYEDENNFFIVSDLCTGGTLFDQIKRMAIFTEKEAAHIMKQILSATNYCHQFHIAHRNLKPENILYDTMKEDAILKIINFGIAQVFGPNLAMGQKLGTIYYVAPEVLKGNYTHKCDIWSCGVILYVLLSGEPPFNGEYREEIAKKIMKGQLEFKESIWAHISPQAINFIKKLLDVNEKTRYSAQEAILDPWIYLMTENHNKMCHSSLLTDTLINLQTIQFQKKLQEVTWMFIVTYMTTKEQKTELLKTFQAFDTNNDGILSREELIKGNIYLL